MFLYLPLSVDNGSVPVLVNARTSRGERRRGPEGWPLWVVTNEHLQSNMRGCPFSLVPEWDHEVDLYMSWGHEVEGRPVRPNWVAVLLSPSEVVNPGGLAASRSHIRVAPLPNAHSGPPVAYEFEAHITKTRSSR